MNTASIPTLRELAEVTLDQREEQGVRGIDREQCRYRVHIATCSFIDKPITELAPRDIRGWLREMGIKDAIVPRAHAPRKLDRATINRAYSLLSVICAEAVEREIIEISPCAAVKQKKRVTEGDTQEKWSYLTPAEQKSILDCAEVPNVDKLAMRFAIGTGLRSGEQFNVELPDLHVTGDDPHVYVRYSNPHRGRKQPPKNGKKRKVPLMGGTLDVAREWLDVLPFFAPENPLDLVFPTPRGFRRQEGKQLGRSKSVHNVYRAAGVPARKGLHWHALRHTFASNLISGVLGRRWSLEEIQILMGHSSVMVTQRYAHLGEDAIKQAVRETNAALGVMVPPECMPYAPISERTLDAELDAMACALPEAPHAA